MHEPCYQFLTRKQTAEYSGVTEYWLEKHARTGRGPRFIQRGRKVYYRKDDLDQWLNGPNGEIAQARGPNNEPTLASLHAAYEQQHGAQRQFEQALAGLSEPQRQAVAALIASFQPA